MRQTGVLPVEVKAKPSGSKRGQGSEFTGLQVKHLSGGDSGR